MDSVTVAKVAQEQFLVFNVLEEQFALGTDFVREIIEYKSLTYVPLMPDFVLGVYNLRGDVIPVIDLGIRFGKGKVDTTSRSCIIIIDIPFQEGVATLGALVDNVSDVIEITDDMVEPAPTFGARLQSHFIRGVVRQMHDLVILLRGENVLSVDEMTSLITHINR